MLAQACAQSCPPRQIRVPFPPGKFQLAQELASHAALRPSIRSKAARAFDLALDDPPKITKAPKLKFVQDHLGRSKHMSVLGTDSSANDEGPNFRGRPSRRRRPAWLAVNRRWMAAGARPPVRIATYYRADRSQAFAVASGAEAEPRGFALVAILRASFPARICLLRMGSENCSKWIVVARDGQHPSSLIDRCPKRHNSSFRSACPGRGETVV